MDKYIGKFRVLIEKDKLTGKKQEATYIPCFKKIEIYRYSDDKLAIYLPGRRPSITDNLKPYIVPFQIGDNESTYLFDELNLEKILEFVKPKTQGKNIKPGNKRTYKKPTENQHNFDAESIVLAR